MDARPNTRRVNRERNTPALQSPRGAKQIVIPMTRHQYDQTWHDPGEDLVNNQIGIGRH